MPFDISIKLTDAKLLRPLFFLKSKRRLTLLFLDI